MLGGAGFGEGCGDCGFARIWGVNGDGGAGLKVDSGWKFCEQRRLTEQLIEKPGSRLKMLESSFVREADRRN